VEEGNFAQVSTVFEDGAHPGRRVVDRGTPSPRSSSEGGDLDVAESVVLRQGKGRASNTRNDAISSATSLMSMI
jgi:hypothetical protein